jgi:acyl carrier protein
VEGDVDTTTRIRQYVKDEILFEEQGAGQVLTDDTLLLNGIVDSMSLLRLVAFLEEEFDIQVDDLDIVEENFRTVADIARLVERARDGGGAGP